MNKTWGALPEILWRTHKRRFLTRTCWPTNKDLHQLCVDTWYTLEDLPGAVDDRDEWWERFREIHTVSVTRWWWCIYTSYLDLSLLNWWSSTRNLKNVHRCYTLIQVEFPNRRKKEGKKKDALFLVQINSYPLKWLSGEMHKLNFSLKVQLLSIDLS